MARKSDAPPGFAPIEQLPDGMLAKVPTRHLVGPKKTLLGRFTHSWQIVREASQGQIQGCPAWAFDYKSKDPSGPTDEDGNQSVITTRSTVVAVDLGMKHPGTSIRDRSMGSKLLDRWTSPGWEIGDADFDRQFVIYTNSEEAAQQFFNTQVRAHLLGLGGGHNWDVGGAWLVLWRKGKGGHGQLVENVGGLLHRLPPNMLRAS